MANQFVKMEKDGERIDVHPLMVAEHERLKWRVVGAKPVAVETGPNKPPKKNEDLTQGKPDLNARRNEYADSLRAMSEEELKALAESQGVALIDKRNRTLSTRELIVQLVNHWNEENQE